MICRVLLWITLGAVISCAPAEGEEASAATDNRPNIVYILADDLGYGELGVYGQEKIETPNLDALAREGLKFTDHYAGSPVCAPSRYMLMTGKHPGNAYIRANSEVAPPEARYDYELMLENPEFEGQRPIPASTVTVADLLQEAGYVTGAFGKWGLGGPESEGHPNKHGFDHFFGYLCQRQAHTYYPTHLWRNDERVYLDNDLVNPHQPLPEDADPYDEDSYAPFHDQPNYSATLMHEEALTFIDENRENPFFLYLPTPIPHVSLQAPRKWVDYYRDKFGDEEPYSGDTYVPVRYPNATYAAMISYLDEQVGEIVDKLKEHDLYENSLIIFTSDNGPTFGGGVNADYFDSAAPFANERGRTKGYLYEGGIRVPMIATWKNRIAPGTTTDHISAFWDVLPTFTELAGVTTPEDVDGVSFLPLLQNQEHDQQRHDYLYWEFPAYGGQQAVRMGKWKGVRTEIQSEGNLNIELYDLASDPAETRNVADQHPEVVNEIRDIMQHARTPPELPEFRMPALGD